MIQVRNNCFETNSSSTHCLSIIKNSVYQDWRDHKIALQIHYIYGDEGIEESRKFDKVSHKVNDCPLNNKNGQQIESGDNGFMSNNGNFDTHFSLIHSVNVDEARKTNVIALREKYIINAADNWYVDYLREDGKYDELVNSIYEYEQTGIFNEFLKKHISASMLFLTPEEYMDFLRYDDCESPFIHIYEDVVAFGYYFHS